MDLVLKIGWFRSEGDFGSCHSLAPLFLRLRPLWAADGEQKKTTYFINNL